MFKLSPLPSPGRTRTPQSYRLGPTLTILALGAGCSNVGNVQLGRESPPFGPFGPPFAHTELGSGQNPTLTADLLEITFTTPNPDNPDRHQLWVAKRTNIHEPFGKPELIDGVNSSDENSSGAISGDGLTFWFSSNRTVDTRGMDVWFTTRKDRNSAWETPGLVPELSTAGNDLPRPVGNHGLQMPLASTSSGGYYQVKIATRASINSPWSVPVAVPELENAAMLRFDAFLTDDGTMLLYNDEYPDGDRGEIYRTWRLSSDDSFAVPVSIGDVLNGPTRNRDPWLSADGAHFFFASDRTGEFLIYESELDNDR